MSRLPALHRLGLVLVLCLMVGVWADFAVRVLLPAVAASHWPGYWAAARLAWDGQASVLYDPAAFAAAAVALGSVPDVYNPNAPLTLMVVLPFGLFPEMPAHVAWLGVSLAAVVASIVVLMARLRIRPMVGLLFLGMLPLFHPLRQDFARGQVYSLLLAGLVVGATLASLAAPAVPSGSRARRATSAGLALGW